MITCERCGHDSVSDDFCDRCGTSLRSLAALPTSTWHEVGSARTARRPQRVGRHVSGTCPECRSPYERDEQFCENCGYDFDARESFSIRTPIGLAEPAGWELTVGTDPQRWLGMDRSRRGDTPRPTLAMRLDDDEYVLGRHSSPGSPSADIDISAVTEDGAISRRHAVIRRVAGRDEWSISDLGSSNGTFVNGSAIGTQPVLLKQGDVVFVGAWTAIVLRRR